EVDNLTLLSPLLSSNVYKELILPTELTFLIIGYLDLQSVCRFTQVNKLWRNLIDNDNYVWKNFLINYGYVVNEDERFYSEYFISINFDG
ncbi:2944_t:CDS:1, partial [Entrophospora sp. SA101]